jgi:hypothetical protein
MADFLADRWEHGNQLRNRHVGHHVRSTTGSALGFTPVGPARLIAHGQHSNAVRRHSRYWPPVDRLGGRGSSNNGTVVRRPCGRRIRVTGQM